MERLKDVACVAGGVLLLVGLCLMITRREIASYIYLVGAVLFCVAQMLDFYKGESFVLKRLRLQQIIGAILLVVTGVLMLLLHHNEWIVCLMVAVVFELYSAFRIPKEYEKEKSVKK